VTYLVRKACSWKTFEAAEGATLTAADLKTADGVPLPPAVVDHLLSVRALVPTDTPPPAAPE
jgi:hypothetical protein